MALIESKSHYTSGHKTIVTASLSVNVLFLIPRGQTDYTQRMQTLAWPADISFIFLNVYLGPLSLYAFRGHYTSRENLKLAQSRKELNSVIPYSE